MKGGDTESHDGTGIPARPVKDPPEKKTPRNGRGGLPCWEASLVSPAEKSRGLFTDNVT